MEWNIEELKLYNEYNKNGGYYIGREKIFNIESKTTREEKIAFVDRFQDGKLSYLLSLINKFNKDKEELPKTNWDCGTVKTISLKAWVKRNDNRNIIDNRYTIGEYRLLGIQRNIQSIYKGMYETYEDIVDECFHRQLLELAQKEKQYFLEHDEYSILKEELREKMRGHDTTFGVEIGSCSNGDIYVFDEDTEDKRDITIDEIKLLLDKYSELEKLIGEISREINIKY